MSEPAVSLDALRDRIRQMERPSHHGVLPFGVAAIDRALPGGGLALGALHEILGAGGDEEDGAVAAGFTAAVLARLDPRPPLAVAGGPPSPAMRAREKPAGVSAITLSRTAGEGGPSARRSLGQGAGAGPVLWCLKNRADVYGPGLAACGLDPARIVVVTARRDEDVLWAVEEGLREPGLPAVVGEIGRLPMVAGRRLQLAAERSGVTALLLRRWRNAADAAAERNRPSAAVTRWRIAALPSSPPSFPFPRNRGRAGWGLSSGRTSEGTNVEWLLPHPDPPPLAGEGMQGSRVNWVGKPRWRVELLHCRSGGLPGVWEVEIDDATTGLVSLPAELADRPAAPHEQRPDRRPAEPERHRRRAG